MAVPIPSKNEEIALRAYEAGAVREQVKITAIGRFADSFVATVWYPASEDDRPQGWDYGLRYAIASPLPIVKEVARGWRWKLLKMTTRRNIACRNSEILSIEEISKL